MAEITSKLPMIHYSLYHLFKESSDCRAPGAFLCLLTGSVNLEMDHQQYHLDKEDIIYIPSETSYTLFPQTPCLLLYVDFHPFFLLNSLGTAYQNISFYSKKHTKEDVLNMANHLAEITATCLSYHESDDCKILAKAYDFLHYISANHMRQPASELNDKSEQKKKAYLNYMATHYCSPISLTDAANFLGYTPQYLSNFIKKNLNVTFQESLNQLRIQMAIILVRFSEESVSRISSLCGFPNTNAFIKVFEQYYQSSPDDYRQTYQNEHLYQLSDAFIPVTTPSLILDYLYNYLHYTSHMATLQEKSILQEEKINLSKSVPLANSWNKVINLGPITAFEKPLFRYTLRLMQEQLHFSYGRCIGLFLMISEQEVNGQFVYDFSKLFEVIDFMRSICIRPFFELSNKPFDIYNADEITATDYVTFLDSDNYDAFFFRVFPCFIREAVSRYGFDYFSSWKFELWRKYNPGMTSLESPQHYCERFQKTAEILKRMIPDACLGGPGFNTFLKSSRFSQLLVSFSEAEYKPDFFSAYCFPYLSKNPEADFLAGYSTVAALDNMKEKINSLKKCISDAHMEDIPLYITEYSAYLSQSNYINDSNYPALFILQQYIDNYGSIDVMAYWLASDIPLLYGNYSSPFFGGNGVFSKDIIPKASYYAFDFLNKLGCNYVSSGKHYIVTSKSNSSFQVLCFHAINLNQSFAVAPNNQEVLHYPYSAFEYALSLDLNIKLSHIQSGSYLIREFALNLKYGNVLRAWGQLNYWKELNSEEINYLKYKSSPSIKLKMEYIDGNYILQTHLGANEAKLYTFELHL
jgi:beta-xylosidase/AraC-like DNA-binding protein